MKNFFSDRSLFRTVCFWFDGFWRQLPGGTVPLILQKTEKRHHSSRGSPTSAVTACRMVLYTRVPVPVTGCMSRTYARPPKTPDLQVFS